MNNFSAYPLLKITLTHSHPEKLAYAYYLYHNGNLIHTGNYSDNASFEYTVQGVGIYKIRIFIKLFDEHYSNAYCLYEEVDYSVEGLIKNALFIEHRGSSVQVLFRQVPKSLGNKAIVDTLIKTLSAEKDKFQEDDMLIRLLVSGIALKKDFFEFLSNKGYENISVYSTTSIGDYLYLSARFSGIHLKNMLSDNDRVSELKIPSGISKLYYTSYHKVDSLAEDTTLIVCENQAFSVLRNKYANVNCLPLGRLLVEFFDEALVCDPLRNIQQNNPGVKVLVCTNPSASRVNHPSEHEVNVGTFMKRIKEYNGKDPVFGVHGKDSQYIEEVTGGFTQVLDDEGIMHYGDRSGAAVNIIAGYRVTTDQPHKYDHTVYLFGSSLCIGTGADDRHTVASCLQRCLLENGRTYRVVNCSNYSASDDDRQMKLMESMTFHPGDIIISMIRNDSRIELLKKNFLVCEMQSAFDRPHNFGEIFMDDSHLNFVGYQVFAQSLYSFMEKEKFFEADDANAGYANLPFAANRKSLSKHKNPELLAFEASLRDMARNNKTQIGAIVANCNPFTFGHLYLMETAAKEVAHLYIFVVEEDASFFAFKDRYQLVKDGTKHLKNVTVIPSGKFIISKETFPAYSNKEHLQEETIDPSFDVKMFAQNIAPALGITVRFVGEEPTDNVTNQYNRVMSDLLPQYGIDFHEIKRKQAGDNVISASLVRKLLKEKRFDEMKNYVPDVTYQFLLKHYS